MYAEKTTVPVDKSLEELRKTLVKVGATDFSFGNQNHKSFITFTYGTVNIRMEFDVPSHPGKDASMAQIKKYEQARRTKWRQILLYLKAKFEFINCGIETFDQAFGSFLTAQASKVT
jgi:hypothetical protein